MAYYLSQEGVKALKNKGILNQLDDYEFKLDMVRDHLREYHNLHISIDPVILEDETLGWSAKTCKTNQVINGTFMYHPDTYTKAKPTYHESLNDGIIKACKLIKDK